MAVSILAALNNPMVTPLAKAADVELPLIGSWPGYSTRHATAVAIDGDFAYLAAGSLHVIDISNSADLKRTASYGSIHLANDVVIDDHKVYVIDGHQGLHILDISDAGHPHQVGSCDIAGWPTDIAVSGDYAFVGHSDERLSVIDVSDPAHPLELGAYVNSSIANSWIEDVAVYGDHVFLAHRAGGLVVIDISDPENPQRVGGHAFANWAFNVEVFADYAYVLAGYNLHVLDIRNPQLPVIVATYDANATTSNVTFENGYAYLLSGTYWLDVLDVRDPRNLIQMGRFNTGTSPVDVVVSGGKAFVAEQTANWEAGMRVVDVGDPSVPTLLGEIEIKQTGSRRVVLAGEYAYLFSNQHGELRTQVFDVSNPSRPELITELDPSVAELLSGGTLNGDRLYSARGNTVYVSDLSDPAHPQHLGQYESTFGAVGGFSVSGNHVSISGGEQGFEIVDVTNPISPTLVTTFTSVEQVFSIAVKGNSAFLGTTGEGSDYYCQLIDITVPGEPVSLGKYGPIQDGWQAEAVYAMSDTTVCLVSSPGGDGGIRIRVINFSDPASPKVTSGPTVIGTEERNGFTVSAGYGYLLDAAWKGGGTLQIFDLTHPAIPRVANGFGGDYWNADISGDKVFLAGPDTGLHIFDLTSVLARPRLVQGESGPTIQWEKGTLQFAPSIKSNWIDLPAASPMNLETIGEQGFFRVKVEE